MNYKSLILITCLYISTVWSKSSCNNGLTKCYSKCTNLHSDKANCGRCGNRCKSGQTCSKGKCNSCQPGAHLNSAHKCVCTAGKPYLSSFKQKVFVDFENPPYTPGSPDGQNGWESDGSVGPNHCGGPGPYDHRIVSLPPTTGFGSTSLRISNAVTSGCFDFTYAPPLLDFVVGEADATFGPLIGPPATPIVPKLKHFEMQFDIKSVLTTHQPDLFMSVSPDRGDGSRMSYLGFRDVNTPNGGGIKVNFYEVTGSTPGPANFVESEIALLDRTKSHRIRLTMDVKDGPSNDVVKVYIDCKLVKKGTSWENYYRYDPESVAEQSPRVTNTVLFITRDPPALANAGKGYLIDNVFIGAK